MKPKASVVIPAYREEKYLGTLLAALARQTTKDFEVLVSVPEEDKATAAVARAHGAQLVLTQRNGPGAGRNAGAQKAKGGILIFLDADTVVGRSFIQEAIENLDGYVSMTCSFACHDGRYQHRMVFLLADALIKLSWKAMGFPYHPGFCIIIRKDAFQKLHGFRSQMAHSEDVDLSRRVQGAGKSRLIDRKILVSSRRLHAEGTATTCIKYLRNALGMLVLKRDVGGYQYGIFSGLHHNGMKANRLEA